MSGSDRPPEMAAGGILWRKKRGEVQILLAHRPRYDDWGFPKGRLDDGESLMQCGIREVIEETGLTFSLGGRLPDVAYVKPGGRDKRVAYWAMRETGGDFVPNREVDAIKWATVTRAHKLLTYDRDREILLRLRGGWRKPARRLIVIRHALAGRRGTWGEDDQKRPLSDTGKIQAKSLPALLEGHAIDRIVSSPAKRCVQTVKPLAATLGLAVTTNDDLWEEARPKRFRRQLVNTDRSTVVVCSHRPILEDLIARVVKPFVGYESVDYAKGSTWVLDFDRSGTVIDAHHQAPPAV